MGIFDDIGSFFSSAADKVGNIIGSISDKVGGVVGSVAETAKSAVSVIHDDVRGIVSNLHQDARDTAGFGADLANKAADTTSEVIKDASKLPGQALDTAKNVAKDATDGVKSILTSPVFLIGVGLLGVVALMILPDLLSSKKRMIEN
jgi:phage-related protein